MRLLCQSLNTIAYLEIDKEYGSLFPVREFRLYWYGMEFYPRQPCNGQAFRHVNAGVAK